MTESLDFALSVHAARHATGGEDPLTPVAIGAVPASAVAAGVMPTKVINVGAPYSTAAAPTAGGLNEYDCTAGALAPVLPLANSLPANSVIGFSKTDSTVNVLTVTCSGSDHIDSSAGSTSIPIRLQNQKTWVRTDGVSVWSKLAGDLSLPTLDARYSVPLTAEIARATAAEAGLQKIRYHNTQIPFGPMVQSSSGRSNGGVDFTNNRQWSFNSGGFYQADTLTSQAWNSKTMPTNCVSTQGVKAVLFGGKVYALFFNSVSSRFELYSANPVSGSTQFSWSSVLLQLAANATMIGNAMQVIGAALYIGEYSGTNNITGGPSLYRTTDGAAFANVLQLATSRHFHGVYPDTAVAHDVYATCGDGGAPSLTYVSHDDGVTWSAFTPTNPVSGNNTWQAVAMGSDAQRIWFASDQATGGGSFIYDRASQTCRWATTKGRHDRIAVPGGVGGRTVTDMALSSSTAVASALAGFAAQDVGRYVRGNNSIPDDAYVKAVLVTTIAVASNGAVLPQATLNVASTTGFATAGSVAVATSLGVQIVAYTGVTSTTFTGCTGGTGTLATGGSVVQATLSAAATSTQTGQTATIGGDVFYATAYQGALDPLTGYWYIAANDTSQAGNVAGIFVLTAPDEPWTLLHQMHNLAAGNHEMIVGGGYLWFDRFQMPLLTAP